MPDHIEAVKAKCTKCGTWVPIRVELHIERSVWNVCGRCAVAAAVPARLDGLHIHVLPCVPPMLNAFATGDGRYFATGDDATRQQQWLRERCVRYARRVQRVVAREVLAGMTAAVGKVA